MIHKITIPLYHEEVAPRFDMATEVLILILSKGNIIEEEKTIILPRSSADELCHLMLSEHTNTLICGAIEEEYYQFLKWKKIDVYDSIAGSWADAFHCWEKSRLKPGDILSHRIIEGRDV
ncbi:MAG: hypothetical protein DRH34_06490 [Deltaproteobacteria bacterium]|nr:MAG: hypothetical protein DRH34_06490 [Deltaproteobacteria bacterium]RLC23009.1 MAG: hypothetical protein DRH93_08435 [Deltaproteobacteria bacterium]